MNDLPSPPEDQREADDATANEGVSAVSAGGDNSSVLNAIRTETALSRFPCHRIARKGTVSIEIKNQAAALLWEVTYNSKYGQPGPLAYKLDTLVINRRLDESGRPVPKLLKLGSLPKIAGELGKIDSGPNLAQVRAALHQNASAYINAKIQYRATDGTEKHLEAGFTRYAVVFTGETLPDGRTADAVYLILSDIYQEVLNHALTRPLDYEYMKALPPAAQRFYEIVSYQIYAALKHQNPRARLLYSEYCLLSTATRYFDFDHVKKQMYKTHKPHLESGYLLKTQYEATTDGDGKPDWIMYYTPGPNADREFQAFVGGIKSKRSLKEQERREKGDERRPRSLRPPRQHSKGQPEQREQGSLSFQEFFGTPPLPPPGPPAPAATETAETRELIAALTAAGINRRDAERFARTKPEESRRQLAFLPYASALRNRGAYLRRAIEDGFDPPAAYAEAQEARDQKRRKEDEARAKQARQEAQEARRGEQIAEVEQDMARLENDAPAAFAAFVGYIERKRAEQVSRFGGISDKGKARIIAGFETPERRRELFEEWRKIAKKESTEASSIPGEPKREPPAEASATNATTTAATAEISEARAPVPTEEDTAAIRALIQRSIDASITPNREGEED